jgi:hypothetical protein
VKYKNNFACVQRFFAIHDWKEFDAEHLLDILAGLREDSSLEKLGMLSNDEADFAC